MADDVWNQLYDDEAARKAQALMASAFGAADDPAPLVAELGKVIDWLVVEDDGEETAKRMVPFLVALTMLGRTALDVYAEQIAAVKLSTEEILEPSDEQVRSTAFDLLSEYAAHLRGIAGQG